MNETRTKPSSPLELMSPTSPRERPAVAEREERHQRPADELELLIRARYPVVYVVTYEEGRLIRRLGQIARRRQKQLHVWGCASGMRQVSLDAIDDGASPLVFTNVRKNLVSPIEAMSVVLDQREPAIYLFQDLHLHLTRTQPCMLASLRKVRDVACALTDSYKSMVISSPVMELPLELEKDVTVIDFSLPSKAEISGLLTKIERDVEGHPTLRVSLEDSDRKALVRAAGGLTLQEAENVFAKTLVNDGHLGGDDVAVIVQEKQQVIRKSGILEYIETAESLDSVGGLEVLKEWLERRSRAFSDEARKFGLPAPKGALLVGVQGCGKSLCAKAVSRAWNMPLVRFDVGRVFSSFVGSSESNVRRAIQIAESVSPVVLWIDEIEKGLAGAQSSGATDGGTMSRVMATLLTWLNEKTSEVFVVATANDVTSLPPELLRKGRLDEIFFVDLPGPRERARI
ncbi:MAG: AAA family ATPase, partial [Phycisphaerales bacterium]